MENESERLDGLQSSDPDERASTVIPILLSMYEDVARSLNARLGNHQLAEDITQETFLRALGAITKNRIKQLRTSLDVIKYVWMIAKNLVYDHYREVAKLPVEISLDELSMEHLDSFSEEGMEQGLDDYWYPIQLRYLCQFLPDEKAQLSMILVLSGYSFEQVSWLVRWSKSTVRRYALKSMSFLDYKYSQTFEYSFLPGKRDHLLSFTDDQGDFGITFTQADPKNFSSETAQMLCQRLGLQDISQLKLLYNPVLVILKAYTENPIVRLSFLPRTDMNPGVLRGASLNYLDSRPIFRPEHSPGQEAQKRLWLDDVREFKAWIVDHQVNEEDGTMILTWWYDIPGGPLEIIKEYDMRVFSKDSGNSPALIHFLSRELPVN